MTREQTLFFICPDCEERFTKMEEFDSDIHTGEVYHCSNCGIRVIFQAFTLEQYGAVNRLNKDCYFCKPDPCTYGGSTPIQAQKATVLKVKRNGRRLPESGRTRGSDA